MPKKSQNSKILFILFASQMTHFVLWSPNTQFSKVLTTYYLLLWHFHEIFGDFCLPFFQAAPARLHFPGQPKLAKLAILVIGSLKIRPRCTGFTSPKSNSPPSPHLNFVETLEGGRFMLLFRLLASVVEQRSTFLLLVHLGASSQPYGISFLCLKLKIS